MSIVRFSMMALADLYDRREMPSSNAAEEKVAP